MPRQPFAGLVEMEGSVPHQPCSQMQEMQHPELSAGTDVPFNQWPMSQMTDKSNDTRMVDSAARFPAQFMHPRLQPGPHPLTFSTRQTSFDSTADTVLGLATPGGGGDPDALKPFNSLPNFRAFEGPSIQKRTRARKASAARGKKAQPGSFSCEACEFFPSGDGLPRKLKNHLQTNIHRKRMGDEGEGPRFPCWICSTTVNRLNNLWTHVRNYHGIERPDPGQSWMEYYQSLQAMMV